MNILFCIDHLRADGTQRVLEQLLGGLTERGHRVAILCLNDSFDRLLLDRLRRQAAELRIVGKPGLLTGYGLWSTLRWMRRQGFDTVVTMLFASDVIARPLAAWAGVPRVVSSIRARNTNYHLWQLWLVRATMGNADAVVVNSRAAATFAVAAEGVAPHRLVHIANGIDPAPYRRPMMKHRLRAELGLADDAIILGSVGRLNVQKGFDIMLRAVALLDRHDVHTLMIGSGGEEERLRKLAVGLQIAPRVQFVGYRHDLPQLLGALDLYVHPARFEGTPNALLEAMAAACPIVASAVDGSAELIVDGTHGWLVPPEDPPALAAALQAALSDRTEAARRAAAALQRAQTDYSLVPMLQAWEEVLVGKA